MLLAPREATDVMQRRATFAELAIMKVAVISGGPSSLVTLKYLCEVQQYLSYEPVKAVLFEYQNDVGGTFLARAYEDAELVSSKQLTCFSDFHHPSSKDFLSARELVMVVGCGETGADVAYLAATHPEVDRVVLCHNDGFYFTLKVRRHPPYHCTTPSPLTQVAAKRNPGPVLLPILGRVPSSAEPGIPIDVSRPGPTSSIPPTSTAYCAKKRRLALGVLPALHRSPAVVELGDDGRDGPMGWRDPARRATIPPRVNDAPACRRADTQQRCANFF
ncbi:hypothetical protein MY11210_006531 [Beauveria gryllotalpidicola]